MAMMRPETPEEQWERMFWFAYPGHPVPPRPPDDSQAEAEITDRDRALAVRFWSKYASPLLKRLLGARSER